MQISVQNGEGQVRRMTVELPQDEIHQEVDKRLKDTARTVRINGFRPGKVPTKLVRSRFGSKILHEVVDEQINQSFQAAVEQENLRPVQSPKIEINNTQNQDPNNFSYTAVFEVYPDIVIAPLNSYTIERPVAEVTESDVDAMLEDFRLQRRVWQVVDRPAQLGDKVTMSMRIATASEQVLHKEVKNLAVILGSGTMIQELEASLVGTCAGESKSVALPTPNNLKTADNAGEATTLFEVTNHAVATAVLPEVDAELIKYFGVPSGDMEEFRAYTRKNMTNALADQVRNAIKWQVMSLLLETNKFQPPMFLVEMEKNSLLAEARKDNKSDPPAAWLEDQAMRRVRLQLIVGELMRQGTIALDGGRVQTTIQKIADSYDDPQEAIRRYTAPDMQKAIENLVLEEETVDWVLTQVTVQDTPSSFKELMDPNQQNANYTPSQPEK